MNEEKDVEVLERQIWKMQQKALFKEICNNSSPDIEQRSVVASGLYKSKINQFNIDEIKALLKY